MCEEITTKVDHLIFARLTPLPGPARKHFDLAVETVNAFPDRYIHARKNMHIRPARAQSVSTPSVFTDAENVTEDDSQVELIYKYEGEYLFRFDNPPRHDGMWRLGDGRQSASNVLDILLTGPNKASFIAGVHALLYFHPASSRLILEARHRLSVPDRRTRGEMMSLSPKQHFRKAELGLRTDIRIGQCSYIFEYDEDVVASDSYQQSLQAFMKSTKGESWESMSNLLSPTPSEHCINLGGYEWDLGAFAEGTFGRVTAGTRPDGTVVAIKRILKADVDKVNSFRTLMAYIGQHPHIVRLLDCFMMPDAKICEAVSVYEPLCQVTLDEARNILSYTQLLTLSCQYLDGLSYLHDKKSVLHRDIKPTNLGLATVNPPWGIILDVDNAWKTTTCTDHMVGTLCFLAPEIVDLKVYKTQKGKNMRQPSPYGCPADVWALGASFWETHIGVRRENICINIARYNEMIMKVNHLDTVKPYGAEYRKILRQMLAWQPDSRILAGQAHAKMAQLEKLQQHEDGRPTIPIEDEEEQPPRSRRRKSEK